MARVRLTQRMRRDRRGAEAEPPYPGTVNQPNRQFKPADLYDDYEETLDHPIPDMRHEWQDEERDEIGFGIPEAPTVASVRVAANKAVRIAILLLGDKVDEQTVEAQATDLMALPGDVMDRTLARYAKTQSLYAQDEDEDAEADEDKEASEKTAESADEPKTADVEDEPKTADVEDDDKKVAEDARKAADEAKKVAEEAERVAQEAETKMKTADTEDADDKTASEKTAEDGGEEDSSKTAEDDGDGDENADADEEGKEAAVHQAGDFDVELGPVAESLEADPEADAQLASLFDGGVPADLPEPGKGQKEASAKKGISRLGGQPKVASGDGGGVADISQIWGDTPDVSDVFR